MVRDGDEIAGGTTCTGETYGVDAASSTDAFRLYERAGMTPALGWVVYEKALDAA